MEVKRRQATYSQQMFWKSFVCYASMSNSIIHCNRNDIHFIALQVRTKGYICLCYSIEPLSLNVQQQTEATTGIYVSSKSVFISWSLKPGVRFNVVAELADPRSYWTPNILLISLILLVGVKAVSHTPCNPTLPCRQCTFMYSHGRNTQCGEFTCVYNTVQHCGHIESVPNMWDFSLCNKSEKSSHQIYQFTSSKFSSSFANLPLCSRAMAKLLCGSAGIRHNHK